MASAARDRTAAALSAIPKHPHKKVCVGGHYACKSHIRVKSDGSIDSAAAAVSGFGPADLASAYALDTSGTPGATIAIVDAFGYPNAESDLAAYRSNFGLPPCSVASGCLTIVNQTGQTSPLPPAPTAADDWTVETALDLDMASSACPNCKILLIQAQDDQGTGLFVAQNTAASMGATVVSNSWGGPADGTELQEETNFNHSGVGYFVASGDNGNTGATPDYPSTSAFVTGVGGTSLTQAAGTARGWTEGAWSGSGSSCSTDIAKPGFQTNTVCNFRAAADVSAVADPNTGLAVFNNGPSSTGWIVVGGTSAACPFTAGVYALTGHGADGPSLSYNNPGDFFDVTSGNNGSCGNILCNAGPGWDGPTGNGTPNGAKLKGGVCTPQCSGKQCGNDGCGGSCGSCPGGETCNSSGQCVTTCTPQCTGKQCGDDGCGGSCGSCPGGETCNSSGQCVTTCTPQCTGLQCGPDGCGGSCGSCPSGETCNAGGQCVGGGGCAHPICSTGGALASGCDPCATQVCGTDPYCCSTAWDSVCVGEVSSICGQSCGGGGSCAHSECSTGGSLTSGCDPCVTSICSQDPYCCQVQWDSVCVSEVSSICGTSC